VLGEMDSVSLFEQLPGQRFLVTGKGGFHWPIAFFADQRVGVLILLDGEIPLRGKAEDGGGKGLAVKAHAFEIPHTRR